MQQESLEPSTEGLPNLEPHEASGGPPPLERQPPVPESSLAEMAPPYEPPPEAPKPKVRKLLYGLLFTYLVIEAGVFIYYVISTK